MTRARIRDLGVTIGTYPTGEYNAITDVPGIRVGQTTLIYDEPRVARAAGEELAPRQGHAQRRGAADEVDRVPLLEVQVEVAGVLLQTRRNQPRPRDERGEHEQRRVVH